MQTLLPHFSRRSGFVGKMREKSEDTLRRKARYEGYNRDRRRNSENKHASFVPFFSWLEEMLLSRRIGLILRPLRVLKNWDFADD